MFFNAYYLLSYYLLLTCCAYSKIISSNSSLFFICSSFYFLAALIATPNYQKPTVIKTYSVGTAPLLLAPRVSPPQYRRPSSGPAPY